MGGQPVALRGRRSECAVFDVLLTGMRTGRSGVLVVRGEAGVGKTALLEYAVESASDVRVLRAVGVESEMELAFAALHQLCASMLDRLEGCRVRSVMRWRRCLALRRVPRPIDCWLV